MDVNCNCPSPDIAPTETRPATDAFSGYIITTSRTK
jgi:hypothetical protein